MATETLITLAGGIKAAARSAASRPEASVPLSPAHAAFVALNDALAETIAAEELSGSPASWDPAYADPEVETAVTAVLTAARAAGDAPIVLASDRKLVFTARLIGCALSMEDGGDRTDTLRFITSSRSLLGAAAPSLTARRIDVLITQACSRLLELDVLLSGEKPDSDVPVSRDAGLTLAC